MGNDNDVGKAVLVNLIDMFKDVPMPVETIGRCSKPHCVFVGTLGDGYCQRHWDRGWPNKRGAQSKHISDYKLP